MFHSNMAPFQWIARLLCLAILLFRLSSVAGEGDPPPDTAVDGVLMTISASPFPKDIPFHEAVEKYFRFTVTMTNRSARTIFYDGRLFNSGSSYRIVSRATGMELRCAVDEDRENTRKMDLVALLPREKRQHAIDLLRDFSFMTGLTNEPQLITVGPYAIVAGIPYYTEEHLEEFDNRRVKGNVVRSAIFHYFLPHPSKESLQHAKAFVANKEADIRDRIQRLRIYTTACPHDWLDVMVSIANDPQEDMMLRLNTLGALLNTPKMEQFVDEDSLHPLLREKNDDPRWVRMISLIKESFDKHLIGDFKNNEEKDDGDDDDDDDDG